jgi:phage tail-like protein
LRKELLSCPDRNSSQMLLASILTSTIDFKVKCDGTYVAGICKVSVLKRTTEVVKRRASGDPSMIRLSPGQSTYDAITLEQGVTHEIFSSFSFGLRS